VGREGKERKGKERKGKTGEFCRIASQQDILQKCGLSARRSPKRSTWGFPAHYLVLGYQKPPVPSASRDNDGDGNWDGWMDGWMDG